MQGVRLVSTPAMNRIPAASTGLAESCCGIPEKSMWEKYLHFHLQMTVTIRKQIEIALAGASIILTPLTVRAQAKPFEGLDEYITSAMKDWKIPGVAVGIVRNDSVVFAKGFGVRTVGRAEKVDTHTLFGLASDSKAFTGMLIA